MLVLLPTVVGIGAETHNVEVVVAGMLDSVGMDIDIDLSVASEHGIVLILCTIVCHVLVVFCQTGQLEWWYGGGTFQGALDDGGGAVPIGI